MEFIKSVFTIFIKTSSLTQGLSVYSNLNDYCGRGGQGNYLSGLKIFSIFCCRVEMEKGFVMYAAGPAFMDSTIFSLSASAVIKITGILIKNQLQ